MNTPEEMKKNNTTEEVAEPEGKEGELRDESAEAATGGCPPVPQQSIRL